MEDIIHYLPDYVKFNIICLMIPLKGTSSEINVFGSYMYRPIYRWCLIGL